MAECPKVAFPFRGRWLSVKTLAFLPKAGRGRSPGRKHANQRYRRGDDLFRPRCARPPSPEGEGFWMRQPPFLFPVPCSLVSPPNQNLYATEQLPTIKGYDNAPDACIRGIVICSLYKSALSSVRGTVVLRQLYIRELLQTPIRGRHLKRSRTGALRIQLRHSGGKTLRHAKFNKTNIR